METPTRWTTVPFRGSLAVELGLLTPDQLRGPAFRRLHRDTYVGAEAEVDTRVRIQGLCTWSRERGVVAGPLAAMAYGADCPWDDAEIVTGQHCRVPPPVPPFALTGCAPTRSPSGSGAGSPRRPGRRSTSPGAHP